MFLRNIIKSLVYKWQYHKMRQKITVHGRHHNVGPTAHFSLIDGSKKADIIVDDYVDVHGTLMSQSHGKITIEKYSRICRNVEILCVESISIGNNVVIARECVVSDNNTHPVAPIYRHVWTINYQNLKSELHLFKYSSHKPITIKDNVWIGERCRVCKGVTIGKNCVIGANSIVTKDIPDNCIAVGNPAKVVKTDIDKLPNPTDCKEFNDFIAKYGTDF